MNPNNTEEVGYVVKVRDFLVHLDGLPSIRLNDMVASESGARGWVNSVGENLIEVLMLDEEKITPKKLFKKTRTRLGLNVGDFLLGRAVNPLGVPIDGRGLLSKSGVSDILELEQIAPGIESRQFIKEQFLTGITLIDTLIPIGKGQRELVLGDAHSGKTGFLLDLIINQKNTGVICIYASIGKPSVTVRNLIDVLKSNGALEYTVIVAASSSEPAPLIYLTPKTALTVAEYFQKQGKDVLLILDDLGTHAKIYREIALLSDKAPGKESYPGDTFYQHAHLLERAGNFLKEFGGGSITAIPVIELDLNDFTTLIPTNLMAMTDGHLLFKSALRAQGQTPAIDISLSVSRVGRQTQDPVSNLLSTRIRQILSEASDLETISRFSSELPPETQLTLRRRDQIMELLKQDPLTPTSKPIQAILLALPFTTFFKDKNKSFVENNRRKIADGFLSNPLLLPVVKQLPTLKTDEELIKILEGTGGILTKICQN